MAKASPRGVAVDLSKLPRGVQSAVGSDLALSIATNMKLAEGLVIIGKLGPGIYGFLPPDRILSKQIGAAAKKLIG